MQEDVGKDRANARALRRAPVRLLLLATIENASPPPQLDEPLDARIGDPVRHHPRQPLVVDRVEGSGHRLPITVIFQIR